MASMKEPTLKLTGKVAVVIGGSGGIGAAAARMLADEGATIVDGGRFLV
jgi:NAD(P)-dependent dehydrogenase (short-subunit alcohol dehydrogenase family)